MGTRSEGAKTEPTPRVTSATLPKNGVSGQNADFWGQKKKPLFNRSHVPATTGQSCQKKKVPFSQMNISLLANFGIFFGKKLIFGPFSAFRQNVKTAVSP